LVIQSEEWRDLNFHPPSRPKLNVDDFEKVATEAYHKEDSVGGPPRKPMGIFKVLIIKRFQIPGRKDSGVR
jgi:hypothetical protein